ncbi:MAG: thiazole synthase, partial [Chitinophagaceae bacterium]
MKPLIIAEKTFHSRLFLGTGKFGQLELMTAALQQSGTELVTLAMKRVDPDAGPGDRILQALNFPGINLLPNT